MPRLTLALFPALLLLAGQALAADRPVFGWVEKTTIEPWGVELKAKLDSGALTSSLHATDVEIFEKDGDDWVRFTVDVHDEASGRHTCLSNAEVLKACKLLPVHLELALRRLKWAQALAEKPSGGGAMIAA